ncbi:MAG: hypothetical protein AAGD25_07735 [Cyanobacteria bacterium P01_F01_bin.150]
MNPNGFKKIYAFSSGLRFWLVLIAAFWFISSVGLWWLVKSIFVLIGILLLLPILAFIGVQIWLRRSLINGNCPVCSQSVIGISNQKMQCPSCGEFLVVKDKSFQRVTPPGTVDVDVVDVSVTELPPGS